MDRQTEFDTAMDEWLTSDVAPGSESDHVLRRRVHAAILKDHKQQQESIGRRHLWLVKSD